MAVVAVPFTHFDLTCAPGDELQDEHELVAIAPHLFVQPDPEPEDDDEVVATDEVVEGPDPAAASRPRSRTTRKPKES